MKLNGSKADVRESACNVFMDPRSRSRGCEQTEDYNLQDGRKDDKKRKSDA